MNADWYLLGNKFKGTTDLLDLKPGDKFKPYPDSLPTLEVKVVFRDEALNTGRIRYGCFVVEKTDVHES